MKWFFGFAPPPYLYVVLFISCGGATIFSFSFFPLYVLTWITIAAVRQDCAGVEAKGFGENRWGSLSPSGFPHNRVSDYFVNKTPCNENFVYPKTQNAFSLI